MQLNTTHATQYTQLNEAHATHYNSHSLTQLRQLHATQEIIANHATCSKDYAIQVTRAGCRSIITSGHEPRP